MNDQKQIIIYGHLEKEPELKYTRNQNAICRFAVAEKIDGEEKPIWHKVIVWGEEAECCQVLLKKGGNVFVQGRVVEKEFRNEKGELKKYKEVTAYKVGYPMEFKA